MTAPTTSPTPPTEFARGTLGRFLVEGTGGWPSEYRAELDGATISVASSQLKLECQRCSHRSENSLHNQDKPKVRITVDLKVERDGAEHILHVEELFPAHILEVLHTTLDGHAAARVRRAIADTLIALDSEEPIENLLTNCIAPMRLYEPLLNSLVPPPGTDTLARWLDERLAHLLFDEHGALEVEACGKRVRLSAEEIAMKEGLRAQGEVKLVARVEVECSQTGQAHGEWKSRAILSKPSCLWKSMPQPDDDSRQRILELARQWRDHLSANIARSLEEGRTPIMLSDVAPELPLLRELGDTDHPSAA